jgi:hypothetical protein
MLPLGVGDGSFVRRVNQTIEFLAEDFAMPL